MTLDQFLTDNPDTAAAFAARVGISPASMARIRRGGQNVTLDVARKIVAESGGKVSLDDLATARAA